jgi:hypothetical protein
MVLRQNLAYCLGNPPRNGNILLLLLLLLPYIKIWAKVAAGHVWQPNAHQVKN